MGKYAFPASRDVSRVVSRGLNLSSPTLAAAQDAVNAGSVVIAEGWTKDQVIDNVAMGYAVTYIFGLVGLIMMIKYLPKFLNIDLVEEAKIFENSGDEVLDLPENVVRRTYRITKDDIQHMDLETLKEQYWDKTSVVKVKRENEFYIVDEAGLQPGDIIEVLGPRKYFAEKISKIGEEIATEWKSDDAQDTAQVIITNEDVVGHRLDDLAIHRRFGLLLMQIKRKGKHVSRRDDLILEKGDVLTVIGAPHQIEAMGEYMGQIERDGVETDIVTLSFGIVIGLIIGSLSVTVGGVSLGLGSAGGLFGFRSFYRIQTFSQTNLWTTS